MLNLMGDDTGWTKYGVLKRLSVGDDKKTKQSWNRLTGDSYVGGTGFTNKLFTGIMDMFNSVFGFTVTDTIWITPEYSPNELVKLILAEEIDTSNPILSDEIRELVNNDKVKNAATKLARKGVKVIKQARDGTTLVFTEGVYTVPNDFIGLPTRHTGSSVLLPYIIETAKFYINYIGSYQGEKQVANGTIRATDKAALYYDYSKDHTTYPYDIYEVDGTPTENNYYTKKEKASLKSGKKFIYYYDKFKDLSTEEFPVHVITNGTPKKYDYNINSHYVGDDCTGFSQGVIYSFEMSKDSTEPRGMYGIAGSGSGLYNHNENASKYQTDDNTYMSLRNLGYERYSAEGKSIDWLQPGDLLCSSDHVEYYVGNNFETVYKETTEIDRQRKKKAGVEEINNSTDRAFTKTIYNYDKNTGIYTDSGIPAAQGTFGWGGVNDEFPTENSGQEMYYFQKSANGEYFELYRSATDVDERKYDTIWRYER